MLYTIKCPYCGTKQEGLDLKETNGSVVCSECEKQFEVDITHLQAEMKKENTAE